MHRNIQFPDKIFSAASHLFSNLLFSMVDIDESLGTWTTDFWQPWSIERDHPSPQRRYFFSARLYVLSLKNRNVFRTGLGFHCMQMADPYTMYRTALGGRFLTPMPPHTVTNCIHWFFECWQEWVGKGKGYDAAWSESDTAAVGEGRATARDVLFSHLGNAIVKNTKILIDITVSKCTQWMVTRITQTVLCIQIVQNIVINIILLHRCTE